MNALQATTLGGCDVLGIVDCPVPLPGSGQVRIRVACSAITPFDVAVRSGRMTWQVPQPPFVMGTEFAGVIDACGEGVPASRLGERVIVHKHWGGMAEFAVVPASACTGAPADMPLPLAMVYQSSCATAWHAIHTAGNGLAQGDVLLLHSAAGPVSIMAAQIAKELGATVIGLAGGREKVEFARSFGMDHVIDYKADHDWPEQVVRLTNGQGASLVIDGVQGPDAHRSLEALAPFGQIVFLGQTAGSGPPIPIGQLIAKSAKVSGMVIMQALARSGGAELAQIHRKVADGTWRYPLNPLVPFAQVVETYLAFENRELQGRTVVAIDPSLC